MILYFQDRSLKKWITEKLNPLNALTKYLSCSIFHLFWIFVSVATYINQILKKNFFSFINKYITRLILLDENDLHYRCIFL